MLMHDEAMLKVVDVDVDEVVDAHQDHTILVLEDKVTEVRLLMNALIFKWEAFVICDGILVQPWKIQSLVLAVLWNQLSPFVPKSAVGIQYLVSWNIGVQLLVA